MSIHNSGGIGRCKDCDQFCSYLDNDDRCGPCAHKAGAPVLPYTRPSDSQLRLATKRERAHAMRQQWEHVRRLAYLVRYDRYEEHKRVHFARLEAAIDRGLSLIDDEEPQ